MEVIKIINNISDLIIAISLVFFLYFVYQENGTIQKLSYLERGFVRVALSLGASGALFDALTCTDNASVLIHVSFAMIFCWAAWFHYKYFIKK